MESGEVPIPTGVNKTVVATTGLVCLTAIELLALWKGFDGAMLSMIVGAISGIVGFAFGIRVGRK